MKKILLIGLLLAATAASAQDSIRYRSPFVAGMLSCVCPGAGQFYNKEKEKGWEYMGVTWGSLIAGGFVLNWAENTKDDGDWAMGILAGGYLIGIGATTWFTSVIDAGSSAKMINQGGPLVYPEGYKRKSPIIAGTLSALLPGGGQFYNGDIEKGVRHLMIFAAGAYGLMASRTMTDYDSSTSSAIGPVIMVVFLSALEANLIWSIVDAAKTANKRNLSAASPKAEACAVRLSPDIALNKAPLALGTQASPTLSAGLKLSVSF